jgi:hypothetical protein
MKIPMSDKEFSKEINRKLQKTQNRKWVLDHWATYNSEEAKTLFLIQARYIFNRLNEY